MDEEKLLNLSPRKDSSSKDNLWPWWPLFPLYPYGRRSTFVKEVVPGQIWSFEQIQGLYYVAVPIRLTVVKVSGGLMLFNPLPPTNELINELEKLEKLHGPVQTIVLPTASGLEHKISLPAMARAFPRAQVWVCPGQWSFPLNLPSGWLGIPWKPRTKLLFQDGLPHEKSCSWIQLGPLDIGLGNFQEIACFHKASGALLVTDSLVAISSEPPEIFKLDPTPLLFHARDRGDQPLEDSDEIRRKGWARLVLFASYLKPDCLDIPPLLDVIKYSFRPGLRNSKAHFGLFPFDWQEGWEESASELTGTKDPVLQVAPVLERLVFPRAQDLFFKWLDNLCSLENLRLLVSSHYCAPVPFTKDKIRLLKSNINKRTWAQSDGNWNFLGNVDKSLLKRGVVPSDPLKAIKDLDRHD